MATPFQDEPEAPRLTKAVQWIIALNVAVFFVQLTVFGTDNTLSALGFQSNQLARAWWTVVTYMFVHVGVLHLLLNMYSLYLFGPRLEQVWGPSEFAKFYLVAGLGGWLFHLLFASDALLVGASAAVLGVTLAYATRWPDDEVLLFGVLPLKVKWLVLVMVGINLLGGVTDQAAGGVAYLAHLGGLAAAWVYLRSAASGPTIDRIKQRVSPAPDIPDETPRAIPRSAPRAREKAAGIDEIVARSNAAVARRAAQASSPAPAPPPTVNELDVVLDKIARQGIGSLTRDERQLLENKSRELRGDR